MEPLRTARMNLPFPRSYWVEPGRLLAGFFPGDHDSIEADYKLQALLDCGITRVFNLMEADEVDHSGRPFTGYESRLLALARQRGQTGRCPRWPIVDRSTPTADFMSTILDALAAALAEGENVYVHCWGGRGRTGTVIGCHLRRSGGLGGAEALAALAKLTEHNQPAFWPAPEMAGQRKFVEEWA